MIHLPAENLHHTQVSSAPDALVNLDRLASQYVERNEVDNIDHLYKKMRQLWESDPSFKSSDIIDCLNKYVAEDGNMPYKGIRSHATVIAQIMKRFKDDGGGGSPIYNTLYEGMGIAVVSNGILSSFIAKMCSMPEAPETW